MWTLAHAENKGHAEPCGQLFPWNPRVIFLTTSEGLNAFRDFLTGGGNLHSPALAIGHHDTGFNARLPGFLKIIKKIQLPRFMRLAMRQVSLASQKLIRNDLLVGEIPLIISRYALLELFFQWKFHAIPMKISGRSWVDDVLMQYL